MNRIQQWSVIGCTGLSLALSACSKPAEQPQGNAQAASQPKTS